MQYRISRRLISASLVSLLLAGCSETPSASSDSGAKTAPVIKQETKGGKTAKRRPKDMNELQGPLDVVQ